MHRPGATQEHLGSRFVVAGPKWQQGSAYKYAVAWLLLGAASLLLYEISQGARGPGGLERPLAGNVTHQLLAAAACEQNLSAAAAELEAARQEAKRSTAARAEELEASRQECEKSVAGKSAELEACKQASRCEQPWEKLFPKERVPPKCPEAGSDREREERRRSAKAARQAEALGLDCGEQQPVGPITTEWALGEARSFVMRRPLCEAAALLRSPLDCVAVATVANDSRSWGSGRRTFSDFLSMISNFTYPRNHTSLNVLVSDGAEYTAIKQVLQSQFASLGYRSVKLFLRQVDLGVEPGVHKRHPRVQRARRRLLARLRNWLLFNALDPSDDSVLWIDADMRVVPGDMLQRFVDSQKDIVVPLVTTMDGRGFEGNTWVGPRAKPSYEDRIRISTGGTFVPSHTAEARYIDHPDLKDQDCVEVDSVGGTILFVQADVHRQGVVFPTQYLVGGEWEFEGYDAIETEGICYLAQRLCYKCWGMPKVVAKHGFT